VRVSRKQRRIAGTKKRSQTILRRITGKKVHVFISYARSDHVIAKALHDVLTDVNPDRVDCFLDTEKIGIGREWQPELLNALHCADWLICVYTGEQSEYCGYEIGIFSAKKKIGLDKQTTTKAPLVCLHDVIKLPEVFNPYRHVLVAPFEDLIPDDANHGPNDLVRFLDEFYAFHELRTGHGLEDQERRREQIYAHAEKISDAFRQARKKDAIEETFTQPRIELAIRGQDASNLKTIPADSEISADGVTLALFGLTLPQRPVASDSTFLKTTWGRIRETQAPTGKRVLWMEKIEQDICDAARGDALKGMEVTFQSGKKIYRPILARHTLYGDGSRTFYILLVETLPRRFLGHTNTSLLLAGLVQASRFRFAYLEEWDRYRHSRFDEAVPDQDFLIHCTQLRYDLERLEHEAAEYGLLDRKAFIEAYGDSNRAVAESFGETWDRAKSELLKILPSGGTMTEPRPQVRAAIIKFFREMAAENSRFIATTIDVYRGEILGQIKDHNHPLDFS
jgi:TIR domain